jgi:hypothetical protein
MENWSLSPPFGALPLIKGKSKKVQITIIPFYFKKIFNKTIVIEMWDSSP